MTKSPSEQIMIGKYQIIEDIPGKLYSIYYKDWGIVGEHRDLVSAIIQALESWDPNTIQEYRSA